MPFSNCTGYQVVSYKEKVGERQSQRQKLKQEAGNKLVLVSMVVIQSPGFVVFVGCPESIKGLSRGCGEVVAKLFRAANRPLYLVDE